MSEDNDDPAGMNSSFETFRIPAAAANQGGDAFGEGAANNQAAQAIDQGSHFGGGINQGQAGERKQCFLPRR
jgi:hypothetical protein